MQDVYRKSSFHYLLSEYCNHSRQRLKLSQKKRWVRKATMIHPEVSTLIFFRNQLLEWILFADHRHGFENIYYSIFANSGIYILDTHTHDTVHLKTLCKSSFIVQLKYTNKNCVNY